MAHGFFSNTVVSTGCFAGPLSVANKATVAQYCVLLLLLAKLGLEEVNFIFTFVGGRGKVMLSNFRRRRGRIVTLRQTFILRCNMPKWEAFMKVLLNSSAVGH